MSNCLEWIELLNYKYLLLQIAVFFTSDMHYNCSIISHQFAHGLLCIPLLSNPSNSSFLYSEFCFTLCSFTLRSLLCIPVLIVPLLTNPQPHYLQFNCVIKLERTFSKGKFMLISAMQADTLLGIWVNIHSHDLG